MTQILDGKNLSTRREDGNLKSAFAAADKVVEKTYHSPFLPHNCMEPMNFYANVTPDRIHLVGLVQTPEFAAVVVADMLNYHVGKVHLEMTRMGGGFGRRLYGDFVYEAAEISAAIRKPIKVISTREDDMTTGIYRPAIKYRIVAALKDGKVTGYHLKEAAINGNMYGAIPHFFPAGCIPNYKGGRPEFKNFDTYRLIRMNETPKVEVYFVENNLSPTGLGEPGLPPAGGAVANAINAALGKRLYSQPFVKELKKSTVIG